MPLIHSLPFTELPPRPGDDVPDRARIPALLALAVDPDRLCSAQALAARRFLDPDGEVYPADGCAILLSLLMREAGFDLQERCWAIDVPAMLLARGWVEVPPGDQRAGDIGSTCREEAHHGEDHVFLVVRCVNQDEMIVVDNQAAYPHFRWASGQGGKTPAAMFYRAPAASVSAD
ncbi:hypothetical protein PV762_12510 [Mitsuaria sp. CC2]|jgi:hypothetical protein|uniref:hypothetical protein n=1 Tax=Mitsuaria sp. CC2 TaxID=3029186 RepID=UPI0011FBAAED|nr:MAG: hypothetical protein EOP37_03960 [Rubrivivax sp.]